MSQKWQVLEGNIYQFHGVTIDRDSRGGFGFRWNVQHRGVEIKRYKDLMDAMAFGEQLAHRIK